MRSHRSFEKLVDRLGKVAACFCIKEKRRRKHKKREIMKDVWSELVNELDSERTEKDLNRELRKYTEEEK